jgi:tetratricopeptide (TPR) repeat protein
MAAATPSPTAGEIVDRYVEARGGIEKLRGIQSIIYRGTYRENGEVDPGAAMAMMRPYYKIVGDPEKPNPEFAEGYDGSAWEFYGDFNMRTVGAAAAAARHGLAIEGPLADYEQKGSTVTVMGLEKVGDRDAYRLRVRMRDGFEQDELIDAENWRLIAERKVAPIHAFGRAVASEERFSDFRTVEGVLFAFSSREVEIATGRVLNEMAWNSIVLNQKLDPAVFSPPVFSHTPLQSLLEHLFAERQDVSALDWSYREFRRAYPQVDTDAGIRGVGYHILKTGEIEPAIALLQWNSADYPHSSGAAFGLGRAFATAGRAAEARAAFERALTLDPANKRARDALQELAKK